MLNLPLVSAKFFAGAVLMFAAGFSACLSPEIIVDDAAFESLTQRPDEPPIAKIEGTYIYASDVSRQAEAQNLIAPGEMLIRTDPRFDRALQDLIDQRLLALSSLGKNLHENGGVQRRVSLARERILSSVALEEHLAKTVTEKTIRAAYERQVELGRSAGTFEDSRDELEALLTAERVQQYVVSLRKDGEIEMLTPKDTEIPETEDE